MLELISFTQCSDSQITIDQVSITNVASQSNCIHLLNADTPNVQGKVSTLDHSTKTKAPCGTEFLYECYGVLTCLQDHLGPCFLADWLGLFSIPKQTVFLGILCDWLPELTENFLMI